MRKPLPFLADWEITHDCNLMCPYCHNPGHSQREPKDEELRQVLKALHKGGIRILTLTGGEPLLVGHWASLAEEANHLGLRVNLITNGTLLGAEECSMMKSLDLGWVQVSLKGSCARIHNASSGVDAFDRTVENIRHAVGAGLRVRINTTVTSLNVDDVPRIVELADHIGVRELDLTGVTPFGVAFENWGSLCPSRESLTALLRWVRCIGRPTSSRMRVTTSFIHNLGVPACSWKSIHIVVDPFGRILPCEGAGVLPIEFWSLLDKPLKQIWSDPLSPLNMFEEPKSLKGKCLSCERLSVCRGGCRIVAYSTTGDIRSPDPRCPRVEEESGEL